MKPIDPKTKVKAAMLAAAAHIEARPEEYEFTSWSVPDAGECGCMWGWTGLYLGLPAGTLNSDVALACGCVGTGSLYYSRSGDLMDPVIAAAYLREFAETL